VRPRHVNRSIHRATSGLPPARTAGGRILAGMGKRVVVAGIAWAVVTLLAFAKDPILGASVGIFAGAVVVVIALTSNWDSHPDFEERELVRARRRAARKAEAWEKNKDARERDRVRYAAHRAKQAAKAAGRGDADRPAS
jgi:hypothetical protein